MSPKSDVGAWMKFYPKDWLSVRGFTLAMRGAYIDLLAYAWEHGGIPADPAEAADILGVSLSEFDAVWKRVGRKWEAHPDDPNRLVNPKQEGIRREQTMARDRKRRQRDKGRDQGVTPPETITGDSGLRAQGSGIRAQGAGVRHTRAWDGGYPQDKLRSDCVCAGLPDWVHALLEEYRAHRAEVADGRTSELKTPRTPSGWVKLGRRVQADGEAQARRAFDKLMEAGWDRLSGALDWAKERPAPESLDSIDFTGEL